MLTELIISLIAIAVYLFILISPFALLIIIIKRAIRKRKEGTSKTYKKYMDQGPYGTGWKWNENTGLWEKDKEIKLYRTEPSYEEWKASKEQKGTTNTSEYHYVGDCIPKERIRPQYSSQTEQPPKQEPIKQQDEKPSQKPEPVKKPTPTEKTAEYQNAYQAAEVFTRNERNNYVTLKKAADLKDYIICPKMRLADIVTPRNDPQYMSRFGKIKSKHLDFVIYDSNMRNIITVIELDDNSHNRADRKERDEFVDFILNDCGIRIIHTRYITEDIFDNL